MLEVKEAKRNKILFSTLVFVGPQYCKLHDEFNLKICRSCCGYNYCLKKCTDFLLRLQSCYKYSENHKAVCCRDCP